VEQNREPGYESTHYAHFIFDKGTKNGEKTASSTIVASKSGYLPAEN
jgi:hypothetical protein